MDVHKTLSCFHATKKIPHESIRSIHIYFEIFFMWSCIRVHHKGVAYTLSSVTTFAALLPGAELGGCQGGHCPPKILPGSPSGPPKIFRVTSCHRIEVLHRPLTAPLVSKLAPPVAPPNENVWLRPWLLHTCKCRYHCELHTNES